MRAESEIMPVSPMSAGEPNRSAPDGGQRAVNGTSPGQGFADVLLLGALACQTPVAVLSVPQPGGGWSTLSYGFEHRSGLNDGTLYEAIAANPGPVEFTDMVTSMPRSPLVQTPHAMRWAYGMAIQDVEGGVVGVVAVMDRWLRQLTKREQRALLAMARQLSAMLGQLRRPVERGDSAPVIRPIVPPPPARASRASSRGSAAAEAPQLLRSHEVATIFDVTERTVINWAAAGKLPSLRTIGGHLRFRRDDVMRLLSGSEELG